MPGVFSAEECVALRAHVEETWRRLGAPVPYDAGERVLDEGVSLSSAGFVCRELLRHAPAIGPYLDRPALLDAIEGVLGPGALIEGIAGNLNDEVRPFCYWHNHVGGIHAGYFRERGLYPEPERAIHRLVAVLYLDGLSEENGEMLVFPRALGAPARAPHDDFGATTWPGQEVVHCPDGSLLLLDEYTWHAVRRQRRSGLRRYMGLYAIRFGAGTTSFTVPSLPAPAGASARFAAMLAGRQGMTAPTIDAVPPCDLGVGVTVRKSSRHEELLLLEVLVGGDAATIEVQPFAPGRPSFRQVGQLLVTYRGRTDAGPRCAEAVAVALERLGLSFDGLARRVDATG